MLHKKSPTQIKMKWCHQNKKPCFSRNTTPACHFINQNKPWYLYHLLLCTIFPFAVQTLLKPNLFLASFNALILILVKLSVIDMFFPFSLLLLVDTCLLSMYLTNLTIMGLFLPLVGTPILCVKYLREK